MSEEQAEDFKALVLHLPVLLSSLRRDGIGFGLSKSGENKEDATEPPILGSPPGNMKPERRETEERDREEGGTSLTDANLDEAVKPRPRPLTRFNRWRTKRRSYGGFYNGPRK